MEGLLLFTEKLSTEINTREGIVRAVDEVDLFVEKGKITGIVGESGCGKTILALSILRLVPKTILHKISGKIFFAGVDLQTLREEEIRKFRGKEISMIFQEPMTFLNPVLKIGEQVAEKLRFHLGLSKDEALTEAIELLKLVGIPSAQTRINQYPHQLSGGLRQRIMIAMAIACNPKLIIADEPTTALDVTLQAQIIELLESLRQKLETAFILISHDLELVAKFSSRVLIMYAGSILENCPADSVFSNAYHPYTEGLINSLPGFFKKGAESKLIAIPGNVPPLYNLPAGCRFQDRCKYKMKICTDTEPMLKEIKEGHLVRCWKYE